MAKHIAQLGERHAGFAHVGFGRALAQIRHERGVDLGFVRQNGFFQRDEALSAEGEFQRSAGGEKLPLGGDELLDGGGVHAFSSFLAGIS